MFMAHISCTRCRCSWLHDGPAVQPHQRDADGTVGAASVDQFGVQGPIELSADDISRCGAGEFTHLGLLHSLWAIGKRKHNCKTLLDLWSMFLRTYEKSINILRLCSLGYFWCWTKKSINMLVISLMLKKIRLIIHHTFQWSWSLEQRMTIRLVDCLPHIWTIWFLWGSHLTSHLAFDTDIWLSQTYQMGWN